MAAEDRRDMSSPAFVPAEYYEDLIARASLPELLKTTSTLATGELLCGAARQRCPLSLP